MIGESPQIDFLELRIADNHSCGIDQCHPTDECAAGRIGERIRTYARLPLRCDESSFPLETRFTFCGNASMESAVDDGEDRADQNDDDDEGVE